MANYANHIGEFSPLRPKHKPQTQKDRKDQVKNSAGGFVYSVDDFQALDRFLILGSEGGTYYATEKEATIKNAGTVQRLLNSSIESARKVIDRVVEISESGRAIKNDPAILVLAMAMSASNPEVRSYAAYMVPKICRTGTHLFTFVDYVNSLREGWGRSLRRAIGNWYNAQEPKNLAYQVCKYQSRTKEGSQTWSHVDVLRKAHVRPATMAHSAVLNYVTKGWSKDQLAGFDHNPLNPFNYLYAHEKAKTATSAGEIVELIKQYNLARESIPTKFLNDNLVWSAMLPKMPMTAMIRNLATMTRNGVVGPLSSNNQVVVDKLLDKDALKSAKVHPITLLNALKVYQSGSSHQTDNLGRIVKSNTWTPVQSIVDALDEAFYLSFDAVEPTGKRISLNVDCSGSMSAALSSMPKLRARDVAAALALVTAKTEHNYMINGFTSKSMGQWAGYSFPAGHGSAARPIQELAISPRMRMDSVVKTMENFPWGGTDCGLPMLDAIDRNLKVDAFVIITDNETYQGTVKADEALRRYRAHSGIHDAKLIVLGVTATNFTIADVKDRNMFDVVGCDSSAPTLISSFIRGEF